MARPVSYNNRGQETNLDSGIPAGSHEAGLCGRTNGAWV